MNWRLALWPGSEVTISHAIIDRLLMFPITQSRLQIDNTKINNSIIIRPNEGAIYAVRNSSIILKNITVDEILIGYTPSTTFQTNVQYAIHNSSLIFEKVLTRRIYIYGRYGITGGDSAINSTLIFRSVTANEISLVEYSYAGHSLSPYFIAFENCVIALGKGMYITIKNGHFPYTLINFTNCAFYGNHPYGLNVVSIPGPPIDAENNWWGDPSGPYRESINPSGKGDVINADPDVVDFIPWLEGSPGGNKLPVAVIEGPATSIAGSEVEFDASGSFDPDGSITVYRFDFGDGASTGWISHPKARHVYTAPGTYNVTVYVYDDQGFVSKAVLTVNVVEQIEITTTTTTTQPATETVTVTETTAKTQTITITTTMTVSALLPIPIP